MAHFAEINKDNIVTRVVVVPDEHEHRGQEFLAQELGLGGTWIQTSFNTINNKHIAGGTPLRAHFAGIGMTYDAARDAFIPLKTNPSFIFDEDTYTWVPPVPVPIDASEEKQYKWDEELVNWIPFN